MFSLELRISTIFVIALLTASLSSSCKGAPPSSPKDVSTVDSHKQAPVGGESAVATAQSTRERHKSATPAEPTTAPEATTPPEQAAENRPNDHAQTATNRNLQTLNLRPLSSPNRDFAISVPEGWNFQGNNNENPIIVSPQRVSAPSATIWVGIRVIPIVEQMLAKRLLSQRLPLFDTCGPIGATVTAHTTRWNPGDALDVMLAYLRDTQDPTVQLVSRTTISGEAMEATLKSNSDNIPSQSRVILSMSHFQDEGYTMQIALFHSQCSAIPMQTAYESFASLTSCRAPAGNLEAWEPVCAAIFASFNPFDNWLDAYGQQVSREIQAAGGQVNQIVSQIRRAGEQNLRNETDYMSSNAESGKKRARVLGGLKTLQDENGTEYRVEDGHSFYCMWRDGPHWTDNLNDNDFRKKCIGPLK